MKRCLGCESRFDAPGWRCPACAFEPARVAGVPAFAADLAETEIGYDPSRYAVLARLEAEHFWFTARTTLIVQALRRHFAAAHSLLEIGCGTGNLLASIAVRLPGWRLVGAEAHAAGLAVATPRAVAVEWLQADARRLPYRDEFDVVGAFDVIEHVEEDERVLAEMFAACRPGGGIVLTVPQHQWLWSYRDQFARHQRRYRRRDVLGKLAGAGFERPWATSFVSLLLPLLCVSRRRAMTAERFDAARELEVGRATNRALGAVMALERGLIAAGASLPVGGSLLVVAHKPVDPLGA